LLATSKRLRLRSLGRRDKRWPADKEAAHLNAQPLAAAAAAANLLTCAQIKRNKLELAR